MSERDVVSVQTELIYWKKAAHVLTDDLRAAEARLPHWRSPDAEAEDGAWYMTARTAHSRNGPPNVFDTVRYCARTNTFFPLHGGWISRGEILGFRPLAEVVAEIPEELKR